MTVTVDGKTYTLTRTTKKIQAAWSKWLTDRAEERAFITADKYAERAVDAFAKAEAISRKYEDVDANTLSPDENDRMTLERDKLLATGRMHKATAQTVVERFNDRVASGEFEFYGNVALEHAQHGLPGQIMLVYLCLQPKHPDITLEQVERLHMLDADGVGHVTEWRDALLKSEGVRQKKGQTSGDSSTPTQSTPTPAT